MRFKIHGEHQDVDEKKQTTVIEILGKHAIEQLIDEKIRNSLSEIQHQIDELRDRVFALEELQRINKKELQKLNDD